MGSNTALIPEAGQAVQIRGRLGIIKSVETQDDTLRTARYHLVEVEYLDDRKHPESDLLLWELETAKNIFGSTSLPRIDETLPDKPGILHAYIDSHRWTRLNRLTSVSEQKNEPILSIWNAPIQVHPYQLEPVVKALEMPRVALLLADGVGLGKTIQAGLVMQELMLRRKIRKVLIVCPAMLQRQWQSELKRKFNLDFEIIDLESSFETKRRLGIDTNPWKAYPRIITSMDYLRMPDIIQQFKSATEFEDRKSGYRKAVIPWDLLIVDEAHNFCPQSGRRASNRTKMLREIRFLFEHRLFLTATPHNGKTVSFTGLLELLDPVQFQISNKMDDVTRKNLEQVKVRRLKDDIIKHTLHPPFSGDPKIKEFVTNISNPEKELYEALRNYRHSGQQNLELTGTASEKWVGHFIFSVLTKRLLSCPFAFAKTWWRHVDKCGDQKDTAADLFNQTKTALMRIEEVEQKDGERAAAEEDASKYSGGWFRSRMDNLNVLQEKINDCINHIGYTHTLVNDDDSFRRASVLSDSKTEELVYQIKSKLFDADGKLRSDERIIVFTEYKETQQYLYYRLMREGFNDDTMLLLYGGMNTRDFESIQNQFEDADAPVRLLIATDAASEGINMQEECRWLIHYEIPWSPTKLQQRNGRIWRHGQVRDVGFHYFRIDQDEDLDFLRKITKKIETVEEELGSIEQIFDEALMQHFRGEEVDLEKLETRLHNGISSGDQNCDLPGIDVDEFNGIQKKVSQRLDSTSNDLKINPEALKSILISALEMEGQGGLEAIPERNGFYRLNPPPSWSSLADETLKTEKGKHNKEIVFNESLVIYEENNRRIMRLKKHQVLIRLGHPIMQRAMAVLRRQLHDTGANGISRWTISCADRTDFEALSIVHYYVTASNSLREQLHDEVVSKVFRVEGKSLLEVNNEFQQSILNLDLHPVRSTERINEWSGLFQKVWYHHNKLLENHLAKVEAACENDLTAKAKQLLMENKKTLIQGYDDRIKSLRVSQTDKEIEKIAEELSLQEAKLSQLELDETFQSLKERQVREKREWFELIKADKNHLINLLEEDKENRVNNLLPKRYKIESVHVFPLAVEYIIPASAEDAV